MAARLGVAQAWRDGDDHADAALADSPYDLDYLEGNIAAGEGYDWYYASDAARLAGTRTAITDGSYGEPWVWRSKDIRNWWSHAHYDRPGGVRAASPTAWIASGKKIWFTELGCGAVDKGANQPNIFADPKSAEGGLPYFSSGSADPLMQRQFLRAHQQFWADSANNPAGMVDTSRVYLWTWDARPFPAFPSQTEVWSDGANHATGHWLTGRLGGAAMDGRWPGTAQSLRVYAGSADLTGAELALATSLGPVLPLPPVHLGASRAVGSSDVALSWTRCSRADGDSWATAEAPLENTPERYALSIFSGSTLIRSVDCLTPFTSYSAAQQAADFGAPPGSFTFTIAQVSPVYGAGHIATGVFNG